MNHDCSSQIAKLFIEWCGHNVDCIMAHMLVNMNEIHQESS
jgi:hypothetical protein